MRYSLGELAQQLDVRLEGDADIPIEGLCTLHNGRPDCLTFLANSHYRKFLPETRAGAVILDEADLPECRVAALVSDNPYLTYARAATLLTREAAPPAGVHPTAVVDESAQLAPGVRIGPQCVIGAAVSLGENCSIGPGCVIDSGVRVGADTRLVASVTLNRGVQIGTRCLLHPGVVVGSDGFGLANDAGRWVKVPQVGSVIIGDDVEVGANTTIDRGALEDTVIEDGVKLDNQIQVAHNVQIGAHTAVAGCVGISGSAHIGSHCMLAGGVGVVGHLEIADNTVVTGMSMVTKSITEPGVYSSGLSAMPNDQWNRVVARLRRLDDLARRLGRLEKRLAGSRSLAAEPSTDGDND